MVQTVDTGKNAITRRQKRRGLVAFAFLMSGFLVLLWKLAVVQIVQADALKTMSDGQGKLNVELWPWRGTIYDRNGKELAISVSADSIYVRPDEVKETEKVVSTLADVLEEEQDAVRMKLASDKPFVWVKRQVEKERAAMLGSMSGVGAIEESKRVYPCGTLASHVIGFAGIDNFGLEGIELICDRYLRGVPGCLASKTDARGREVAALRQKYKAASEGLGLHLTIDEVIQGIVERELDRAYCVGRPGDSSRLEVKGATVIVMRPETGEILALANRPTFDPSNFGVSSLNSRRNRAVTDVFEPGSCFKVVPCASALEEKSFGLKEMIFCENGAFNVGKHTIHDVHPYGWLTFEQVVEKSSNIGLSKIAIELGDLTLYRYVRRFGFGEETGCGLPGEVPGLLRAPREWAKISKCTISFGQGIAVTPMQLASAFSAIANGGVLMRPMIVSSVVDGSGNVLKEFDPQEKRRVISEKTAETVTDILVRAVESGTGKRARLEGYRVAGKTGTAQKVDANGTYSHARFVSSFVGYVPAYKPEVTILVVVDEPRASPGDCYGGSVAAPVFQRIASQVLRCMGVPQKDAEYRFVKVAPLPEGGQKSSVSERTIAVSGSKYYKAETQYENGKYVLVEDGMDVEEVRISMPDVSGLTMRDVVRKLSPYQLEMRFAGTGVAVSQSPPAGAEICPGTQCVISFRNDI